MSLFITIIKTLLLSNLLISLYYKFMKRVSYIRINIFIERLCGSGWLILKGAYKRMGSVALIY